MSITFNTNLAALGTQRSLGIAADKTQSSLAKLSSGSRVPTAKDDAAGLAVGTQLKAEVAGLNQASLNASQAISVLQIADGALSTISDILTRMKSLAVQASSGQLSDNDRGLLNAEYTNLRTEINRIANVTSFNGTTLLAGGGAGSVLTDTVKNGGISALGMGVSVDTSVATAGDAFRITYDFDNGGTAYDANDASTYNDDTYKLTVTNTTTGASQTIDMADQFAANAGSHDPTDDLTTGQAFDVNFSTLGVTLSIDPNFDRDADISLVTTTANTNGTGQSLGAGTVAWQASNLGQVAIDKIQALGAGVYDATTGKVTLSVSNTTGSVTTIDAVTGLKYSLNGGTLGADNTASDDIENGTANIVGVYLTNGYDSDGDGTGDADVKLFDLTIATTTSNTGTANSGTGKLVATLPNWFGENFSTGGTTTSFAFKVGTGTTTNDSVSFSLDAATTGALGISSSSIDTSSNANSAITSLTTAISTISTNRANVGASQSRLSFAKASVDVTIQNTTAAESALLDVDVSAEITNFTSQQVLLQAGVSLLAQANQQPALLLRLLQ